MVADRVVWCGRLESGLVGGWVVCSGVVVSW